MTASPQVRLAHDIAAQFRYLPHDEAVAGIAAHIRTFWDPRMLAQLLAAVEAGADVDPLVVAATQQLQRV